VGSRLRAYTVSVTTFHKSSVIKQMKHSDWLKQRALSEYRCTVPYLSYLNRNTIVTSCNKLSQSEKTRDHTISIKRFPVTFHLLLQISMSVLTEHTAVMLMLFVTTPGDPITARAKMDFMGME